MYTSKLRRVGGSVMLTVPVAMLEMLHLQVGASVGVNVDGERLVIEPQRRRRYGLEELLSQCKQDMPISAEDRQWMDVQPVGGEV